MYNLLLPVHNILRGVIVLLYAWALFNSYRGWLKKADWNDSDGKPVFILAMSLSLQFVIGLLLYLFFSPVTKAAFQDFGAAMSDDVQRFFVLEHLLYMTLAVGLSHAANGASKKAEGSESKFKKAAIFTTISLVTLLLGMPWSQAWFPGF